MPNIGKFAEAIHERDKGICWLCGDPVSLELMHVGHIVDRVMGGSDDPDNLAPMHGYCNMEKKPLHGTREHAEEWRRVYQYSPFRALFVHTYQMGDQERDKAFARKWAAKHVDADIRDAFVAFIDSFIDDPFTGLPPELRRKPEVVN